MELRWEVTSVLRSHFQCSKPERLEEIGRKSEVRSDKEGVKNYYSPRGHTSFHPEHPLRAMVILNHPLESNKRETGRSGFPPKGRGVGKIDEWLKRENLVSYIFFLPLELPPCCFPIVLMFLSFSLSSSLSLNRPLLLPSRSIKFSFFFPPSCSWLFSCSPCFPQPPNARSNRTLILNWQSSEREREIFCLGICRFVRPPAVTGFPLWYNEYANGPLRPYDPAASGPATNR